jgi:hypothetical protein
MKLQRQSKGPRCHPLQPIKRKPPFNPTKPETTRFFATIQKN